MKPFTSFSSKPIVHKLGSLSPSISFHVSDRPFSCFTLHSRNEQKSSIFCLLKLVQNKGVCPLHVVPSEHQEVDLEPVESQVQQSEQTNDSKFVRVEFQLLKDCDFGEQFLIVGDDPKLGLWNPLDALPLTWSDGHIWTVELDMPAGKSILYKFILKGKEGDIIWQPGLDRVIQTWETMNRIIVLEDWENAELQKIIEEDTLSQTNEEPPVLPEVSTSTDIVSGIEETQIDTLEKLIDEPVLQQIIDDHDSNSSSIENPMSMFAENIGSSEDLTESKSQTTYKANVVQKSEESADGFQNDDIKHELGYNGNPAALKNKKGTIVEGSLIDFEGGPVLVPGLIPLTEEAGPSEVVEEEKTAVEPSIESFETQDQNIPELSKEQVSNDETAQEISSTSNDETAQEISSTINDELNFHEEQFYLASTMEEGSNSEPIHGNALQNDIQWGFETVKKFLTKFRLF
ncbi:uncharacterized protein [Medicago truncatula]|uniref:uncharacterized protein isoform X2 n=1 Tax=Medicago truncatula TaxID=3880 RepID=UPI000D2F3C08|nr:uncharacterized protein LOC11422472 isoform X2 [Medicago truncatula]